MSTQTPTRPRTTGADPVMFRHALAFAASSFPAHATRRLLHDVSAHRRTTDASRQCSAEPADPVPERLDAHRSYR